MANVFGDPITNKSMGDIGIPITPLVRARLAYYLMHEGGKSENALNYVKKLKAQYGKGIACLFLVYNATGDEVDFILRPRHLHDIMVVDWIASADRRRQSCLARAWISDEEVNTYETEGREDDGGGWRGLMG